MPITSAEKPTAVVSTNYHLDHFGVPFGIKTADGAVAHSACVGFGLERIALALFKTARLRAGEVARGGAERPRRMMKRVLALDPGTYQRHPIHGEGRIWAETNCYADVWIELLHALGHEPIAALPFTFAIDFEGDQWTFFKFPLADLYELYGLDVHELAIWRPLVVHIEEQLERGRPVLVELDSYFLPDTAGTAYRLAHVKSTVAVVEIDVARATWVISTIRATTTSVARIF